MAHPAAALTSLLRASTIQDHEDILKACNAAVTTSKRDITACRTRVVALLKLDRFEDALRAVAEGGDKLHQLCLLEEAYALYKCGRLNDARALVDSSSLASSLPFRHLAAQIAYRAEKFEDAAALYRQLSLINDRTGEEDDIKINLLAADAQLEWKSFGRFGQLHQRPPSREDLEAFETAYNAACRYLAHGDYPRASVLLKRANDLCEASEDLSDEDKKAELFPILLQRAYVLARLGRETHSLALMSSIAISDISEVSARTVARINGWAIGAQSRNPFLTHRLTESAAPSGGNGQLFGYQASILRRSHYALELQTQKFTGVGSVTSKLITHATPGTTLTEAAELGVINAAAQARLQDGRASIQTLLLLLDKRPRDVGLFLTITQLHVQMGNIGRAITLLRSFIRRLEKADTAQDQGVRFAPGLVALAVTLYRSQSQQQLVRSELAKAVSHWQGQAEESTAPLLREAGVELIQSPKPQDAALAGSTFDHLVSRSKEDVLSVAGLVASFAASDYEKIEPHMAALSAVQHLTAHVDVPALIRAGVVSSSNGGTQTRKRPSEARGQMPPAKRRRRRRRLKNYEKDTQPDPERWVPLRDRSSYRPKGKRGRKKAQEVTQGGLAREGETLELVGGAGAVKVEKASTGQGGKKKKRNKK